MAMTSGDHRIRTSKRLIRKALTDLLRQGPIQSISVKQLCQNAGVSRGTFYAHYVDIYDLLARMEEEMVDDLRQSLGPMLEGEPGEQGLLNVMAGLFRRLRDNADLCIVALGPYGDRDFIRRLLLLGREYFIAAYRRSFPAATAEQLERCYAFMSGGCIGLLEDWLKRGMTASAQEIAESAQQIMLQGMGYLKSRHPAI